MTFTIDPLAPAEGRAEDIVPLALVKAHVAVAADETEFDDLLALFRDAAVEAVESRTGKLLSQESVTWRGDYPSTWSRPRIELARGPVVSVESVSHLDGDGAPVTLDAEEYIVSVGRSWLLSASAWPSGVRSGSVEVVFTAGYDDSNRPAALKQAVLMLCGHYFLNREAVVTGSIASELPLGVAEICNRYRDMVI